MTADPSENSDARLRALVDQTGAALPKETRAKLTQLIGQADHARPVQVRAIHHLACSGGTLMSRAIAAHAGVVLLSEIDPFGDMTMQNHTYAPTDMIKAARKTSRGLSEAGITAMFTGALTGLQADLQAQGQYLVLRDHSHSHFCTDTPPDSRPLMGDVLRANFETRHVVTVRHPLDCFLSLSSNGWIRFTPDTLDEYARRHHAFLDAYADVPICYYEHFASDPDATLQDILTLLEIPFTPLWRDFLGLQVLSGDSGRKSDDIALRPRRDIPNEVATACRDSPFYVSLCARLHYDPDPNASPLPKGGVGVTAD